ncbi:hypothetical protein GUITHDRAFT_72699 [Guillardia theta CCMP2712]|uniref:EGF-like domain-containing protein n=1 Tax=Guillardia theta (strain CCMP2712) TaxID=905079 RepID=L1J6F3_GUITC|nr:hypothetical protein GUITHDRAFT_72699 [Guillardia theta CCMP2712]EKX43892.1 hypothetical protein GUITHDRAFT_72699 [Guillardia theta CCMP2712]|eukprot:XP_005830872.1 hypothetical protein GUITHDRAFT_72699 [Guillardia theta CCMP2712]
MDRIRLLNQSHKHRREKTCTGKQTKFDQKNIYGPSCTEACDLLKNCSGNGRCNGQTGGCDCYQGYTGADCSEETGGGGSGICGKNLYGPSCTEECDLLKNCSGNGRCNGQTGGCDCYQGYTGADCSEETGGGGSGICGKNLYGPSCTEECDLLKNCSGNGRCNGQTGGCDCYQGYTGADCSEETGGGGSGICGKNLYGPSCTEACDLLKNCSGNGRCNGQTGGCDCYQGYTGADCSEETGGGGSGICGKNLYGPSCTEECDLLKNCSGNGRCNGQTGGCDCYQGYTGADCSEETGGGGSGICGKNLYGPSCTEECDLLKNCSGNGRCNGQTGGCDCYQGYTGLRCQFLLSCPNGFVLDGMSCFLCFKNLTILTSPHREMLILFRVF